MALYISIHLLFPHPPFDPEVLLTKLYIDNNEVECHTSELINRSINQSEILELRFPLNSFRVDVISTDYAAPEKTQYKFVLEGFENNWNFLHESNSIAYQQLPPGNYLLKIKSANHDGIWSNSEKILPIVIRPPWWRTKLAYLIFIVLGIAVFMVAYTIFQRFYKLRQSLQVEKKMTRFKLRFFTNLSHEFRTPLTLIINPLEELKQAQLSTEMKGLTSLAHKNARYLLGLINQILDFRTLQEKQSRLKITENHVTEFFQFPSGERPSTQQRWRLPARQTETRKRRPTLSAHSRRSTRSGPQQWQLSGERQTVRV